MQEYAIKPDGHLPSVVDMIGHFSFMYGFKYWSPLPNIYVYEVKQYSATLVFTEAHNAFIG